MRMFAVPRHGGLHRGNFSMIVLGDGIGGYYVLTMHKFSLLVGAERRGSSI
jgi:hypothetical protein